MHAVLHMRSQRSSVLAWEERLPCCIGQPVFVLDLPHILMSVGIEVSC